MDHAELLIQIHHVKLMVIVQRIIRNILNHILEWETCRRRSHESAGNTTVVSFAGKEVTIDNRNVVPYNPLLLLKYRAHINVEYCASIKAVKYLYKYIYKGPDQATSSFQADVCQVRVAINEQTDKIKHYEQCRYTGASEATGRIFAFPL